MLGYCDEPLVFTDFKGEYGSSVFDAGSGIMLNPYFVKLVGKVDNIYINSGDTESHACELALNRRDGIGHSLFSSSRRGVNFLDEVKLKLISCQMFLLFFN